MICVHNFFRAYLNVLLVYYENKVYIGLEDVRLSWFGQLGSDLGECVTPLLRDKRRRSLYKL